MLYLLAVFFSFQKINFHKIFQGYAISVSIISMGKRELVTLLCLSSWCLVIVVWLFLAIPRACLQFVIVVFPDHTHLLFSNYLDPNHVPKSRAQFPLRSKAPQGGYSRFFLVT